MSLSRNNFFLKYILILLLLQIVNNALIFLTTTFVFHNPGIPQFRLICAISQIVTLFFFIIITKPSLKELGIDWKDLNNKFKYLYIGSALFILLLVASSYFVMWDIRYYALMTNINFGIATPLLEELIFRGYSWSKFKEEGFNDVKILILTSLFFGLNHVGYYFQIAYTVQFHPEAPSMIKIIFTKVMFTTLLGFFLGFIRLKTKKTFGSIIIHGFLNIIGD